MEWTDPSYFVQSLYGGDSALPSADVASPTCRGQPWAAQNDDFPFTDHFSLQSGQYALSSIACTSTLDTSCPHTSEVIPMAHNPVEGSSGSLVCLMCMGNWHF